MQCSCIRPRCSFISGIEPLQRISQSKEKFREGGNGNAGGKQNLPKPRMLCWSIAMPQSVISWVTQGGWSPTSWDYRVARCSCPPPPSPSRLFFIPNFPNPFISLQPKGANPSDLSPTSTTAVVSHLRAYSWVGTSRFYVRVQTIHKRVVAMVRYRGRCFVADVNSTARAVLQRAAGGSRRSACCQPEQWDAEDWAQGERTLCFATADCQFYTSPYLKTHVMKRCLKQQKYRKCNKCRRELCGKYTEGVFSSLLRCLQSTCFMNN